MERKSRGGDVSRRYAPLATLFAFLLITAAVVRRDGEEDAALIRDIEMSRLKSRAAAVESLRLNLNRTEELMAAEMHETRRVALQLAALRVNITAARDVLGEAASVAAQAWHRSHALHEELIAMEKRVSGCRDAHDDQIANAANQLKQLQSRREKVLNDATGARAR